MNWTHSGVMFAAAGFLWMFSAVIVLVTDAPINPWAAGVIVLIPLLTVGQIRPHRREPRSRH